MSMELSIEDIIDGLHVHVIAGNFEYPGYYIPELNTIFIDQSLDEREHDVVLLHELGHAAKHKKEKALYNATMTMKIKMEYGANRFMIKYLFDRYLEDTDSDATSVNYLDFMKRNDIPNCDENIVREMIAEY